MDEKTTMSDLIQDYFDVKPYLEDRGVVYVLTTEGWINTDCPWCGDTGQHLGISDDNHCHCWKCGGHNIGKLIQLIEDCDWAGAMAVMEKYQNYAKPGLLEQDTYVPPKQTIIPKEFGSKLGKYSGPDMGIAYDFLKDRGMLDLHQELYYSGFMGPQYKFRIAFPVYIRKQLVTFMTRDVTGKAKVPYIAQPIKEAVIPCKNTLYGYDECAPGGRVVLVEGPIDQWKLGRGSLATWGTGWTIEQVALLRSLHPSKVYILYDSEELAQQSAKRLASAIWYCSTEVVYLDDHNDPGELTMEEGKKLMGELT
jgi:hypothetical protein